MPNRYNGRDEDNIPNTDNEDTMLLPGGAGSYAASNQELPPLKRVNRRAVSQQNIGTPKQPTQYDQNGMPPQFPRSELPPQFPHSAPPPPPKNNHSEPQYYDYAQQSQ